MHPSLLVNWLRTPESFDGRTRYDIAASEPLRRTLLDAGELAVKLSAIRAATRPSHRSYGRRKIPAQGFGSK